MTRFAGYLLLCLPFSLLIGCGSSDVPPGYDFVEVKGTVTLPGGKPYKRGMVHFEPEVTGQGRTDQAVVIDGAFTTKMAVGKYRAALDTEGSSSPVPAKYRKFSTSDIHVEVTSGAAPIAIELK